ncbi:MAG: 2-oxo acid dehydrogenase subunit E2, partial [Chloroflexi bacterium]|nr:2-oxo acid dehydrogenase subunit E2 [Chloroflexota bacterium]
MASQLIMPQMGYDMAEGTLVRWLKKEGDQVQRGEPVAEIETDKAVVEMESTAAGVFRKALVEEGTSVPVGQVIAVVAGAAEDISAFLPEASPTISAARPSRSVSAQPGAPTAPEGDQEAPPATPPEAVEPAAASAGAVLA